MKHLSRVLVAAAALCAPPSAPLAPGALAAPQSDGGGRAGEDAPETLAASVRVLVDRLLERAPSPAEIASAEPDLYDAATLEHGDVRLLLEHLGERAADGPRADAARRLRALLAWRLGDLELAAEAIAPLAEREDDIAARLAHARILDARGDGRAIRKYGELADEGVLDEDTEARLRLRMALMAMESGGEDEEDALARFARAEGRPDELRNRCAIVLALLGRPADAVDLYVVPRALGDDAPIDERKASVKAAANGELRVAEWALRAEDWARAQGSAWRAMMLAPVARERRYALTLLAEAHRGDGSLEALLARFSEERDAIPGEAREAWIELLRETGNVADAIAMVREEGADAFSREERRRLLEMYREAGRDDEMVATFRSWITSEPDVLVWRTGLARHFLEEGDRPAAVDVWSDWFDGPGGGEGAAKPLEVAAACEGIGLDDLAIRAAERAIESGEAPEAGYLFLYELHRDRGRLDRARETLERLDAHSEPGAPARMQLAEGYERLGELESAVRVLEGVRAARESGRAGEDLEMRLAWLYSEVGREDDALVLWRELWTRVNSVPRRRFVEDRMMTVASRTGALADIAVELEKKLIEGEADQRDSGLLVRLYTKVGDAVSASEVIDEFLRNSGGSEVDALTEKARIYLACNDYYHYERAVARLVELDPEGRPDYYRQLAMSQLERGKPDQARATLMNLKALPGGDDTSAEFEAGVLALSGLRDDAVQAYRRGLAAHPERIDSYILMANLLKETRRTDLAVGMFQHLAETAERDDLFTIAIDGLLNMLVDAPPRPRMVAWARRITLERLAATEDRPYLYQLLADLAGETNDLDGQVRALENSLAAAGPRRSSILRELMALSTSAPRGLGTPAREGDREQLLAFGRRLVGLGELVPPEVYLDLGDAFLDAGDEASAARTFDLTREFPDGEMYQALSAERFEKAGAIERALERYQSVLAASPTDVPLMAKVAELTESLGDDAAAYGLYRRGYDLLFSRKTLYAGAAEDEEETPFYASRNLDDFDRSIERVLQGVLATLPDAAAVAEFLGGEVDALEADLPAARAAAAAAFGGDEIPDPLISRHPRLAARAEIVRRVAFASGQAPIAEAMDAWLVERFPGDRALVEDALGARARWGRMASARRFVLRSGLDPAATDELLARIGGGDGAAEEETARVPFDVAVSSVLALHADGDVEGLRSLLRRVDLVGVEKERVGRMAVLFSAARATGDQQLVLSIAREWLRLDLEHKAPPYQLESKLTQILGAMEAEEGLALGRYLVARVLEDPEGNSNYVTLLPPLVRELGPEVVETEAVRELLDGFGQRYAYGLQPVLALLPAEDRAGALRGVWSKLEASNRGDFLLSLVSEADDEVPAPMREFILESLPAALEDARDFIEYGASELVQVEHSHGFVAEVARAVGEARPELDFMGAVALVHRAKGGEEGLAPEAAETWVDLAGGDTTSYPRRRVRDALREEFAEGAADAFVAAIDARLEGAGGPAADELVRARIDLLLDAERFDDAEAAIDAALDGSPGDAELLQRLRRLHLRRGERIAAAEALEALADAADEDGDEAARDRHLQSLVREWRRLHAPERALAAKQRLGDGGAPARASGLPAGVVLPAGAIIVVNGVVTVAGQDDGGEGLPRSFEEVREALEDDDAEEARAIFRRLWRQFPVGQPQAPRFFSARSYRNLALTRLRWPAEETDADAADDDGDAERAMGGLLGYDPDEPEPGPEPPDAYARLADHAGLVAEVRRFMRGIRSYELDRVQPLLRTLLAAEVEAAGGGDAGEAAVLDGLLAAAEAGATGRAEQIRLLELLSGDPERVTGAAAEALRALVRTMPPRDAAQILRLARVLQRSGEVETALRLYRWCALGGSGGGLVRGPEDELDVVTYVSEQELVAEAREHLEGDARIDLIEMVLDAANPGDRPWQRERYETLVLETWTEVLGPERALERARPMAESSIDLTLGLRRTVAMRAAPLFAAAGEYDDALRALEVGVARLDPASVTQPVEIFYRKDPTEPGYIRTGDLRALLPVDADAEWVRRVAAALRGWVNDDRLPADRATTALALATRRLADAGLAEEARAVALWLGGNDGLSPSSELWVVDALRIAGEADAAAARERALLAEGRLQPERVSVALERIAAEDGPRAALEAAGPYAEVLRHPAFVEALAGAADASGDADLAALWRERGVAARAAEALLDG